MVMSRECSSYHGCCTPPRFPEGKLTPQPRHPHEDHVGKLIGRILLRAGRRKTQFVDDPVRKLVQENAQQAGQRPLSANPCPAPHTIEDPLFEPDFDPVATALTSRKARETVPLSSGSASAPKETPGRGKCS